ncbi:MAG: hypothetical protein JWL77_6777 [Chthonomonadaceae bacterium]|jgi:hypothetical protein|nr:hypothetical protein [Chthonomonadaceae bacterium]
MNKDTEQHTDEITLRRPDEITLAERVHARFNAANRQRIPLELVEKAIKGLNIDEAPPAYKTPRLVLERLVFEGEKLLHGETLSRPIRYDQRFEPGVNALVIPSNGVGKSSVMKTIKFALTGDDSDYDNDVTDWIRRVWLQFSIGDGTFTSYLSRSAEGLKGVLAIGLEDQNLDSLTLPNTIFHVTGQDQVRERLHQFFFDKFGIGDLSWTYKESATTGASLRSASWCTFFQALEIPDSNDKYLLCDPAHSMGNQEGLIFSVFLGLRLVEPLNRMGVEASLIRKQEKQSEEELKGTQVEVATISTQRNAVLAQIRQTRERLDARINDYKTSAPTLRLSEIHQTISPNLSEQAEVKSQVEETKRNIRALRARKELHRKPSPSNSTSQGSRLESARTAMPR